MDVSEPGCERDIMKKPPGLCSSGKGIQRS
jgi:hypothetical protein